MDEHPADHRRRSTRCSTTRSARRSTGASSTSSCTPTTATTQRLNDLVADASDRGVPIVTLRADAHVARRPQRLLVRQHRLRRQPLTFTLTAHPTRAAWRRCCRRAPPPARCRKLTPRRPARVVDQAHGQGRRLRRLQRPPAVPTRPSTRTDTIAPEITAVARDGRRRRPRHGDVEDRRAVDVAGRVRPDDRARLRAARTPPRSPSHTVELTGLAPGATYYYRVSSTDSAGNTRHARRPRPRPFTTPAGTLVDTRTPSSPRARTRTPTPATRWTAPTARSRSSPRSARSSTAAALPVRLDRAARGTLGGSTSRRRRQRCSPTAPSRTPTTSSPARARSSSPRRSSRSTTRPSASAATSATTRTRSSRPASPATPFGVYARSGASPARRTRRALPGVSLYAPHRFRIEWTPTTVTYYVDGALVATHNVAIAQDMRPIVERLRRCSAPAPRSTGCA